MGVYFDIRQFCVLRDGHPVAYPVHIRMDKARPLCLVTGGNGAGKSSFLDALMGFCDYDVSSLSSESWALPKNQIAHVGHTPSLSSHLYVHEEWPFYGQKPCFLNAGVGGGEGHDKTISAQDFMQIKALWNHPIAHLSRGQKQRVALGRLPYLAMGHNGIIWILDEPEAHLDHDYQQAWKKMLLWHLSHGGQAVIATHNPGLYKDIEGVQYVAITPYDNQENRGI